MRLRSLAGAVLLVAAMIKPVPAAAQEVDNQLYECVTTTRTTTTTTYWSDGTITFSSVAVTTRTCTPIKPG